MIFSPSVFIFIVKFIYCTAAQILIDSLGPELIGDVLAGFDDFVIMSQCDFVAKYGLDYFDISMKALYEMTKRFTAEGAIRPFLQKYPEQTLEFLEQLSHDLSPLARRLASEGTRPRLPLAPRLPQFIKDPRPVLKLLDNLKADPTLLVRRSVANNLNDIAKDNPDLVVETLREWQKSKDKGTQWLIGHASRTLVKRGHREALALLGYPPNPAISVQNLALNRASVKLGEDLTFSFEIHSKADQPQNLMIDYVVYHMKANGKLAPKVVKLTQKKLKAGEALRLSKKHSFKLINTRVYYPGKHRVGVQINGQIWAEAEFELKTIQSG
ncbi:MAG: DNA alkylation repair protein [Chloroflexi bacterium]|nr:DNA alkylation repair protein [Chloroflexota bacterium]